jgi:hypothetical protein
MLSGPDEPSPRRVEEILAAGISGKPAIATMAMNDLSDAAHCRAGCRLFRSAPAGRPASIAAGVMREAAFKN